VSSSEIELGGVNAFLNHLSCWSGNIKLDGSQRIPFGNHNQDDYCSSEEHLLFVLTFSPDLKWGYDVLKRSVSGCPCRVASEHPEQVWTTHNAELRQSG
jgi:hypothetical protein